MRNEILALSNFQALPPSCYEAWKLPECFLRLQGRMLGERICQQQDRYTRILINQFCFCSQSWTLKTLSIWWDEGGTLEQKTLINLITLPLKPFEGRRMGQGGSGSCTACKVRWETSLGKGWGNSVHLPLTALPPGSLLSFTRGVRCHLVLPGLLGCRGRAGVTTEWEAGQRFFSPAVNWYECTVHNRYNWSRMNSSVSKAVVVGGMVAPKMGFALYIFLYYCCIFKFGSNMLSNSVCEYLVEYLIRTLENEEVLHWLHLLFYVCPYSYQGPGRQELRSSLCILYTCVRKRSIPCCSLPPGWSLNHIITLP